MVQEPRGSAARGWPAQEQQQQPQRGPREDRRSVAWSPHGPAALWRRALPGAGGATTQRPSLPSALPFRVGRLSPLPASTPAKGRDAPRGGLPAGRVPPRVPPPPAWPRCAPSPRSFLRAGRDSPPIADFRLQPPAPGPAVRGPSSLSPLHVPSRSYAHAGKFDFHPFPLCCRSWSDFYAFLRGTLTSGPNLTLKGSPSS